MATIVQINNNNYGSTGTIMNNIAKEARKNGYTTYVACKNSKQAKKFDYPGQIFIGTRLSRILSETLAYQTGLKDHFNILNTYIFINKLKKIKPDLIHLHNIHDSFLNLNIFFKYLKNGNLPIVWTFHDCWPITAKCVYFQLAKCDKWKNGCHDCPQLTTYPESKIDKTDLLWKEKKERINSISNLCIVTPSKWLSGLVSESYVNHAKTIVINNGIDLNKFKPRESSFKKKHNLENKTILLGVSTNWEGKRKGLDVFIELAHRLPSNYQIVLVGTNDRVDRILPDNIISIHKTYNQEELIEIYSAADLFINPTKEENFPTVNIEAIACGLPVITYNTGGSPEMIDRTCGSVIDDNSVDSLEKEILRVIKDRPYKKDACLKRASIYSSEDKFKEYVNLYKQMLGN